jgi:hypothetical protein
MNTADARKAAGPRGHRSPWLLWGSWLFGAAALAAVVAVALHLSEAEQFARLLLVSRAMLHAPRG